MLKTPVEKKILNGKKSMQRIQNDWCKSVLNNLFNVFPFNSLIIVEKI